MTTRKALLVGATGLVGGYCLQSLLDDLLYSEVIAFVRNPILTTHRKLKVIVSNFDNLEKILPAVQVIDIFCCLGTTIKKAGSQDAFKAIDYALVLKVAAVMRKHDAQQFLVISAMGANKNSKVFYNRIKGQMEESLKGLDYPCLKIIRPSLLLGPRREFRLGEKIAVLLTPLIKPFLLGSLKKYTPIEAEKVGRFMVSIAGEIADGVFVYESDQML